MFTGIVEELGRVAERDGSRLRVHATKVLEDVHLGDSIAVNGCCLTVVRWGDADRAVTAPPDPAPADTTDGGGFVATWWEADVSQESYDRTALGELIAGSPVNLERPVRLQDRLGGHLVQGHVDGVGTIVAPAPDLRVRCAPELLRYVVEKGSITVDGISLTVVEPLEDGFTVAIIPHTAEVTTLGHKGAGDPVNLEVDVTAKYVERLLQWHDAERTGSEEVSS